MKASFNVEVAKSPSYFSEGEFLRSSMMKVCNVLCPDKLQMFGYLSMGRNIIADRVCEMDTDLRAQLMERGRDFIAFSLAVDERMDVNDTQN